MFFLHTRKRNNQGLDLSGFLLARIYECQSGGQSDNVVNVIQTEK